MLKKYLCLGGAASLAMVALIVLPTAHADTSAQIMARADAQYALNVALNAAALNAFTAAVKVSKDPAVIQARVAAAASAVVQNAIAHGMDPNLAGQEVQSLRLAPNLNGMITNAMNSVQATYPIKPNSAATSASPNGIVARMEVVVQAAANSVVGTSPTAAAARAAAVKSAMDAFILQAAIDKGDVTDIVQQALSTLPAATAMLPGVTTTAVAEANVIAATPAPQAPTPLMRANTAALPIGSMLTAAAVTQNSTLAGANAKSDLVNTLYKLSVDSFTAATKATSDPAVIQQRVAAAVSAAVQNAIAHGMDPVLAGQAVQAIRLAPLNSLITNAMNGVQAAYPAQPSSGAASESPGAIVARLEAVIQAAASSVTGSSAAATAARQKAVKDAMDAFFTQVGVNPSEAQTLIQEALASLPANIAQLSGVAIAATTEATAIAALVTQQAMSPSAVAATITSAGSTGSGSGSSSGSGGGGGYGKQS